MKPYIFLVILILLSFGACTNELANKKESKTDIEQKQNEEPLKLDDPIFYAGSSFGSYFQSLFKQGLFDELVELTDGKSRSTIGDSIIRGYYRNIGFAFEMKLKSMTNVASITWLNYEANIQATKQIFRFPVVVQKNSCKVDFIQFQASLDNIQ
jgi:hypothetical protein